MPLEDLQTGLDLFDYVLKMGNQPGGASDDYAQEVKAIVRKEYWDLLQLERWWWATPQQPGIITVKKKTDVLVSTISGSTVTLSAVLSPSQANAKFAMQSNSVMYRVSAHTSGTNVLTLDAEYVDTPTSGSAWVFFDEHLMPETCLKPWGPLRLRSVRNHTVDLLPYSEYESRFGWTLVHPGNTITAGTLVSGKQSAVTGDMQQIARFAGFTDQSMVLEFPYTQFHNLDFTGTIATDSPRIPRTDRWVIAEKALWTLWRNKNDKLADSAELKARNKIDEMRQFHLGMATRERFHVAPNHSLRAG